MLIGSNPTSSEKLSCDMEAIKAVKRLRDAGYVVNRVVSIIDRQEDGEADTAMKLAGLELISIFKLDELTDENE